MLKQRANLFWGKITSWILQQTDSRKNQESITLLSGKRCLGRNGEESMSGKPDGSTGKAGRKPSGAHGVVRQRLDEFFEIAEDEKIGYADKSGYQTVKKVMVSGKGISDRSW